MLLKNLPVAGCDDSVCGQQLFLKFDALVSKNEGRCGAFKVDTIGDAYVVAAWLKGKGFLMLVGCLVRSKRDVMCVYVGAGGRVRKSTCGQLLGAPSLKPPSLSSAPSGQRGCFLRSSRACIAAWDCGSLTVYSRFADLAGREGGDRRNSGTDRQDAEVLRDMMGLASELLVVVKSVKGLEVACRAGISQGEVCAGMLGLLQPRFQLIGEAMHRAAECEQKATIGTVHASQDVLNEIQAFEVCQVASQGEQTASGMVRERFDTQKISVGVGCH